MAEPGFLQMRASLIERGLLRQEPRTGGTEYRLTQGGHEYLDVLMAEYRATEAPCDPTKPRVRWNYRRRGTANA